MQKQVFLIMNGNQKSFFLAYCIECFANVARLIKSLMEEQLKNGANSAKS